MPTYEAWIPVTMLVRANLTTDVELTKDDLLDREELVNRFRDEGDTDATLCDDCSENIKWEEGSLEQEEIDSRQVKVRLVSK